jgi:putative copper export protein
MPDDVRMIMAFARGGDPMIRASVPRMESQSLFEWTDVAFDTVGTLSSFGILGAVGFRYGVLRGKGASGATAATDPFAAALRAAARIGLVGVVLGFVYFARGITDRAEEKHLSLSASFSAGGAPTAAQVIFLVVLAVAFALAARRVHAAWPVAAAAALALALRSILAGRIAGLVNPLHVLGASLWIGTLFVLLVAGIGELSRPTISAVDREEGVATIVRSFSALALGGASLLVLSGLVTAWKHLNPFAALWTTPYGYVLLAKLTVVAGVFALGAWNWKRVGPALGRDGGAAMIRKTARAELALAGVVLLLTGILVNVPSPKPPKPHLAGAAAAAPDAVDED